MTAHRMHGTPTYSSWHAMMSRCTNPNAHAYERYGGADVTIYPAWREFVGFWRDMGTRPSLEHSLDRYPNPHGNYEPGNVRWATRSEQNTNRCTTRWITAGGETLYVAAWARRLGCRKETILKRLEAGVAPEEAVTRPTRPCKRGSDRAKIHRRTM